MAELRQNIVGVDIGGANLKFVSQRNEARSVFFPMWQTPELLAQAIRENVQCMSPASSLAVTMTGELADCFLDRAQGVEHIVQQTEAAARQLNLGETSYYGVDARFHSAESAVEHVDLIAAANWHALASYVGTLEPDCLLIDIGTTTTDIIPIAGGRVATAAETDFQRLREGSLVYVGCKRTMACALVDRLTYRGDRIPVMNEVFATIDDALLVLGLTEETSDCDTADGTIRSKDAATNRIARMIGLDHRNFGIDDGKVAASEIVQATGMRINEAVERVTKSNAPNKYVTSGHGTDLFSPSSETEIVELKSLLGSEISRSAPAYAVMWLLNQAQRKNEVA